MQYKNVQGLRALAASLVVIPHFGSLMYVPGAIATLGVSGVDIFFVISGFIMCQVAARPRTGALHFLVRRWWRIFPLYWVVLAFSVLMSVYGISWAPWMSCHEPALDYILLTTTDNCHLPQAWTLVFELYFYASVAFVLLVSPPERFYRTLAIWVVAQIILVIVTGPNGGLPVNAQSLEFALGCGVAWLNARNLIRYELSAWIIGLLLFGAGEYWFVQIATIAPVSRLLTFGAGAAFCLYAYIGWERRGVIVFPKPIVRLGDASYSLYLCIVVRSLRKTQIQHKQNEPLKSAEDYPSSSSMQQFNGMCILSITFITTAADLYLLQSDGPINPHEYCHFTLLLCHMLLVNPNIYSYRRSFASSHLSSLRHHSLSWFLFDLGLHIRSSIFKWYWTTGFECPPGVV